MIPFMANVQTGKSVETVGFTVGGEELGENGEQFYVSMGFLSGMMKCPKVDGGNNSCATV